MIITEVKEILAKVLEIDIDTIFDNTTQKDISKWDSLQHLNLIVEIEDQYDISIDPEDISVMITIEKIVEVVNKYKNV
jgi:acyl carrier protein